MNTREDTIAHAAENMDTRWLKDWLKRITAKTDPTYVDIIDIEALTRDDLIEEVIFHENWAWEKLANA